MAATWLPKPVCPASLVGQLGASAGHWQPVVLPSRLAVQKLSEVQTSGCGAEVQKSSDSHVDTSMKGRAGQGLLNTGKGDVARAHCG